MDPLDHETLFSFSLHAPPGVEIDAAQLRGAIEGAGFAVEEGAAAASAAQERVYGEAPRFTDTSYALAAQPLDPDEPALVVFGSNDYFAGMPEKLAITAGTTRAGVFQFQPYGWASLTAVDVHVWSTDEERVRPPLERLGIAAAGLGLVTHDERHDVMADDDEDSDDVSHDEAAEYVAASAALLVELWRAHREDLLDAGSISPRDGSVDAGRLVGMEQQSFAAPGQHELLHVDVRGTRTALLLGPQYGDAERLFVDDAEVALPAGAWNEVHLHGAHGFVLFGDDGDPEADEHLVTAVQFDRPGAPPRRFRVAGGSSCVVTDGHVVVGFSDEAIFSGDEHAENGIVAFDFTGELTLAYQRDLGSDAVDVADVYALTHVAGDVVAFYPYTDFPIVFVDLGTNEQRVVETPPPRGFAAMSLDTASAWLHGAYGTDAVFRLDLATGVVEGVAMTPSGLHLRGLDGGRFLATGSHGWTIFTPAR